MTDLLDLSALLALVPALLRVTTPILLAALGVHLSQRAGVLNLGIEGMMLAAALAGVVVSAATGSAWIGAYRARLVSPMARSRATEPESAKIKRAFIP